MALDTKVGGIYVELSAISKEFDKGMRNASDQLNDFDRKADSTRASSGKNFDKLGSAAQVAFGNIIANAVQTGIGAMGDFIRTSAEVVINYEKQLKSIKAVGGLTVEQIKAVDEASKDLAKRGLFDPEQVAKGAEIFIKAGMPLEKLLNGGLADGLTLATAGEISMDEAAKTVTSSMSAFQREGLTTDKIVRVIAGTANATTADVSDLNFALAQSQAVASAMGLTFADTNAIIGTFAQNGLQGSDAGTSLKTMLMRLQPTTEAQIETMKLLGIVTKDGTNQFFDQNGKIKSAAEIQEVLQKSTEGLTDAKKQEMLTTIFGSDAVRGAIILANSQKGSIQDLKAEMMKVDPYDLATQKTEGYAGAMAKLQNTLKVIKIDAFTGMLDKMTPSIEKMTKFLTDNEETIVKFFGSLGDVFVWFTENGHIVIPILSGIATALSRMVYPMILNGIVNLAGAIKGFFLAFGWWGLAIMAIVFIIMNWDTIVHYFNIAVQAIGGFFVWLWGEIKRIAGGIWTSITNFASGVWNTISTFVTNLWNTVSGAFMNVWNTVTTFFSNVWTAIVEIVTGIVNAIVTPLLAIWQFIKPVVDVIVYFALVILWVLWQGVKMVFEQSMNIIRTFGEIFKFIFNLVIDVIQIWWNNMLLSFQIVKGAINIFVNVLQWLWGMVSQIFGFIWGVVSTVFTWIWQKISGTFQSIWDKTMWVWGKIAEFGRAIWGVIGEPVSRVFGGIWEVIKTVFNRVMDISNNVRNTLGRIFSAVTEGVGNVVVGVVKGVINGIIAIINGAIRGINKLIDKIPEIPGIKKPARLGEIPRLNDGGKVQKGSPYFVGDNPDGTLNATSELFIPSTSGRIVSNSDMLNMLGKSGGVVQNITIQSTVFDKNTVAEFYRKTRTLAKDAGFELS